MASEGEVWVQLATRIPKQLHRELKLYCVKSDVSVWTSWEAVQDTLSREGLVEAARRARPDVGPTRLCPVAADARAEGGGTPLRRRDSDAPNGVEGGCGRSVFRLRSS